MVKVKQLIQDGTLGEIKLVEADFGFKNSGVPRLTQPELGGGAILDIGVYPISLSSFIFGGGKPSKIVSIGFLGSTGVDEQVSILLNYQPSQIASLNCTLLADTPKEAVIAGDKGRVRVHGNFWCPTKLTLSIVGKPDEVLEFPLPEKHSEHSFNFQNSIGMQFEAAHVHQMLKEGRLESNVISLDESLEIMRTMDTIRSQIGLKYSYE